MRHHFESHPHGAGPRGPRGPAGPLGRGGGGSPDHGRGGPGGGRGRHRVFDHGALRLVVLALIAESPRHGYEIIKAIEERFSGSYSPSPGVIYPTLTLLQELGYATVEENEGKKRYSITGEGLRHLDANRQSVDASLARMQDAGARRGSGRAPQIVRAMENLKLALRLRMDRGPLTEEQLQSAAAAIDAAALAIERS
jgi:DNA-binding PadR family transcriptional regulator